MTDFKEAKRDLLRAISAWRHAEVGRPSFRAYVAIEVAIIALTNAAHSRGHAEVRRSATDWTNFYIADSNRSGHRIEKMLRQQADMSVTIEQQGVEIEHLKMERDALQGQLQTQVPALRTLLEEAEAERDGFRGELELLHERASKERDHLRKALETLADRYHAQMCYRNRWRSQHSRENCTQVLAVGDANAALAGTEPVSCCGPQHQYNPAPCQVVCPRATRGPARLHHSFTVNPGGAGNTYVVNECTACGISREAASAKPKVGSTKFFHGKIDNIIVIDRALSSEDVAAILADTDQVAHKPKEEPEIEAVMIGSREIECADGCGRVVKQGSVMYRPVEYGADEPLYASEECARKAAQS